ncbi:hypothetical protein ACFPIJ_38145 [Dactylosporangium cerinum]|uniref:Uncharacterized protein n=1 Tax=Dactylosporangium cerinum TaxID=1434730 RepID=A0ABV9W8I0_9ACTN
MTVLRGIFRFLYDFIIGDDWKIAAAVVSALVTGLALLALGTPPAITVILTAVAVAAAFTAAILIDVRRTGS